MNGQVKAVDIESRKQLADFAGGVARWSPRGNLISYVNSDGKASLYDVTTGMHRVIIPEAQMLGLPLEWSPDGSYLLLPERRLSVYTSITYGRLTVYRLRDAAVTFIYDYGIIGGHASWVRKEN
jgi:WD40 repeat protein